MSRSRLLPLGVPDFFGKEHPNSKVPDNVFFAVKFYMLSIHVIHLGSQIGRFAFQNRESD